MHETMTVTDVK